MGIYEKGSEWRRWDLHIHTKNTAKNDRFKSKDFESFCEICFKKALEKNIAVIGITDYYCIENYKQVKQYVFDINKKTCFSDEEKSKIKKIFILPNVELRILPVADSGRLVNIHCLFNPLFEDKLENNFFDIIHHYGGSGKKFPMNRQGLIDLGKSMDSTLKKSKDQYKKGLETFTVSPVC